MGKGLNIDDILGKLTEGGGGGGGGGGSKRDRDNDMTEQEQADQLTEVVMVHLNPIHFKVGDFVRYRKEARGGVKNGERLHIILERIAEPFELPRDPEVVVSHIGTCRYDVVVGVTDSRDKGNALKFFADSRWLEHYPGGERFKPKLS